MVDVVNAVWDDPVVTYVQKTIDYVNYYLPRYLQRPPPGSKLEPIVGALAKQKPIDIESMAAGDALMSFREACKHSNALKSLQLLALYEGAGNLFWFDAQAQAAEWKGATIGGAAISLAQLIAARSLFCWDQVIASSPDNEFGRFLAFPVFVPSAVGDLGDIKKIGENSVYLDGIPMLAGHATVLGWYDTMATALSSSHRNHEHIRHLYQASRAVPIRLRLDPSVDLVRLDSLAYSEMLRQCGTACIDSFWEFVTKVTTLDSMGSILQDKKKTIKDIIAAAERLKLKFKGKALSTAMAQGLRALVPYVESESCRNAYRLLETVSNCMNDLTKLWKLAQVTSSQYANLGVKEAVASFARVLTHLRVDITSRAMAPSAVSADWLTSYKNPKTPGYAHYVFKQLSFVEFMETIVSGQSDSADFVKEIKSTVLPVLVTPDATFAAFGLKSLLVADGPNQEEGESSAAVGAEEFGRRTADNYQTFKDSLLHEPSKYFADILYNVWSGGVAEELKLRAAEDLSCQQPVPWLKYLQGDGAEEKSMLQTFWLEYQNSVMAKPAPIYKPTSAVGDEITDASADERGKLSSLMHELRTKTVNFVALPQASIAAPMWSMKSLEGVWCNASLGRMYRPGKESRRLLIASADLFPPHAQKTSGSMSIGVVGSVADDFETLVQFLMEKKESRDAVLVFDGRSREVSKMIWNMENFMSCKSAVELTIIYQATDAKRDIRTVASKQKMFAASNKETCFVLMSMVGNKRPPIKPRTSYVKCGESSTHDNTYPGVVHRHLSQIPRLSDEDVVAILGQKAPLAAAGAKQKVKDRHLTEVKERGNPLFWAEYKPVEFWKDLMVNMAVTDVLDFTAGTGAAAAAALHCGIKYEGVCVNADHKSWLDGLMDKVIYAVASESTEAAAAVGASEEHISSIKLFFQGTVKEARRFLVASADQLGKTDGDGDGEDEGEEESEEEEEEDASSDAS